MIYRYELRSHIAILAGCSTGVSAAWIIVSAYSGTHF